MKKSSKILISTIAFYAIMIILFLALPMTIGKIIYLPSIWVGYFMVDWYFKQKTSESKIKFPPYRNHHLRKH